MKTAGLTGSRIRERRLSLQLKQAELAKSAGVSASYLNLIEHNRRRIGGALLVKIAARLQVEPTALSEGADGTLVVGLEAVASRSPEVEADRVEEFVGRFPGWAAKLTEQNERVEVLEQTMHGLNDRLTHDPVLSEKMHDVLAAVAAIRSTSSILIETPNIDADWRTRFHTNIDTESRRLAESSAAMAAHFDSLARDETGFSTALQAVTSFFEDRRFHIEELERDGEDSIQHILDTAPEFQSEAAAQSARAVLRLYAKDALAMPLEQFLEQASALQYDPSGLARQFGADLPSVFRRLATLPRTADTPEIGLVSCDAAGAILLRKPVLGFAIPKFAAACPLWPLFSALRNPGVPAKHRLMTTEDAYYTAYTIAAPLDQLGFDGTPVFRSYMLLISDVEDEGATHVVGPTCRLCPKRECEARREPTIVTRST